MGLEVTSEGTICRWMVLSLTITHENNTRPEARITRCQGDINTVWTSLLEASTAALVSQGVPYSKKQLAANYVSLQFCEEMLSPKSW
jgi:hypothetical protein